MSGAWQQNYNQYMKSPAWKSKRAQAIFRDGGKCTRCKRRGDLEVHHQTYERLGNEWLSDLVTVCVDCHKAIHAELSAQREALHA